MVEFFLAEYSKEEKAVFRVKGFQGKTNTRLLGMSKLLYATTPLKYKHKLMLALLAMIHMGFRKIIMLFMILTMRMLKIMECLEKVGMTAVMQAT
ncbi:hypothetical protein GGH92_004496 [Coemansia sp. RSA 2673]|nr:hypothetical protein GGH92_004496 [Coemansia sp. RSA 2673]